MDGYEYSFSEAIPLGSWITEPPCLLLVEILDMDPQDPDKYDKMVERYEEIAKATAYHEAWQRAAPL